MKIYRYYKLPEDDSERREYLLYAVTNNKKLAKQFEETRDMKKFAKRVSSDDLETYRNLIHENPDTLLDEYSVTTRTERKNGTIGIKDVIIVCTQYEITTVKDASEECAYSADESYWSSAPPYLIYKKKLQAALRRLEYQTCYKFYCSNMAHIDTDNDDYSAPDLWIDELGAFIKLFKHTF